MIPTSRRVTARLTGLLCLALGVPACGESVTYGPYDGSAWPDRRPRVALPAEGGAIAVVTNNGSDTLSVIDLGTFTVVGTHPIGLDPVANDGPHHLSIDPIRRVLFTVLAYPPPNVPPGPHGSHGFATTPGVLVSYALEDLRELGRADTDLSPGDVVLTPDRSRVLVTHYDLVRALEVPDDDGGVDPRLSRLIIYDATTLTRVANIAVGIACHGVAVSADSTRAFIACYGSDDLAVVSLDAPGFPVERIPVGPSPGSPGALTYGPHAATISPDSAKVYVSDLEGEDLREFDVATRTFDPVRTVHFSARAFFPAMSRDGTTIVVPVQFPDGIYVIQRDTLAVTRVVPVDRSLCVRPHHIALAPDGRYYLACEGNHRDPGSVLVIDPVTFDVVGSTTVGIYPDALGFFGS